MHGPDFGEQTIRQIQGFPTGQARQEKILVTQLCPFLEHSLKIYPATSEIWPLTQQMEDLHGIKVKPSKTIFPRVDLGV